ncbi:MAG: hypothetical protein V4489_05480 [Chlamydiota bacterium]
MFINRHKQPIQENINPLEKQKVTDLELFSKIPGKILQPNATPSYIPISARKWVCLAYNEMSPEDSLTSGFFEKAKKEYIKSHNGRTPLYAFERIFNTALELHAAKSKYQEIQNEKALLVLKAEPSKSLQDLRLKRDNILRIFIRLDSFKAPYEKTLHPSDLPFTLQEAEGQCFCNIFNAMRDSTSRDTTAANPNDIALFRSLEEEYTKLRLKSSKSFEDLFDNAAWLSDPQSVFDKQDKLLESVNKLNKQLGDPIRTRKISIVDSIRLSLETRKYRNYSGTSK